MYIDDLALIAGSPTEFQVLLDITLAMLPGAAGYSF